MKCDLCNRDERTTKLLCGCCADMIQRLIIVNARMKTREVCVAERLAMSAQNGIAVAEAGATAQF